MVLAYYSDVLPEHSRQIGYRLLTFRDGRSYGPGVREPTELVSTSELLERFPWLTERRLRSMVNEQRVPYWKVMGRLLFDPQDFRDLLNAGYVAPMTKS